MISMPTSPQKDIKTCPACGESILKVAKKCRYCGEWLEEPKSRPGSSAVSRGTPDARAVTKGLKEKEYHDFLLGCGTVLALVIAIPVGCVVGVSTDSSKNGWAAGIILFLGIGMLFGAWYYKE